MRLDISREETLNSTDSCQTSGCHSCCSCIESVTETESLKAELVEKVELITGIIILAFAVIFSFSVSIERILYLVSYILIGKDIVLNAIKNIIKGKVFDENFLMTIATIGAFTIGEFPEAVVVMLFYRVGEWLQDSVVRRSRKSIAELMDIKPDFANRMVGDDIERVHPTQVAVGDVIIVKPGEKVPLDGIVVRGESTVDTSALTGESIPREVGVGSQILSGFVNQKGVIYVEVTRDFDNSTTSRILDLVENARNRKAPTEKFITKFARYYTPGVVLAAALIAVIPPIFWGQSFEDWVYRALVFLVVSCPCALVISIPVGFFGGLGGASRNGILIKGGQYLEALSNVDTVVFDKTGTLTKGVFEVTQVIPEGEISKEDLLEYAALAESYSTHPIAVSILKAFGKPVKREDIDGYNEIPGYGVEAGVKGRKVLVGTVKLLQKHGIKCRDIDAAGTIVHVALDGQYAGYFVIADEPKEDSAQAVSTLKKIGVKRAVMLTGDNHRIGDKVGQNLEMDEVYSELLPHQKVKKLDMIEKAKTTKKGKVVFVGDGVNDAPVLARADVGVAMGGLGSDAAIEAADVVLMTDEPSKLVSAIMIANGTKRIVWQNIFLALGVKGLVLLLGAVGIAGMWEAVFADVGVAILSILNAMRIIRRPVR